MSKMDEPDESALADRIDYRCRSCMQIVPRGTHHKMESCKCGKVQVDRGWYGSRVLWCGGKREDAIEEIVR
jgi:hypothetical protein